MRSARWLWPIACAALAACAGRAGGGDGGAVTEQGGPLVDGAVGSGEQLGPGRGDAASNEGGGSRADSGSVRGGDGAAPPRADGSATTAVPAVAIHAGHYVTYRSQLQGLGPFIVYGWAADPALNQYARELATLASIQDPGVSKMVIFSSAKTVQSKLSSSAGVAELKNAGVTWLDYNSEGDKTPASEMQNLPQAVQAFAQAATRAGFAAGWGPIRSTADAISDAQYAALVQAGLSGLALQEQKPIESSCAADRTSAVKSLVARLRRAASGKPFRVTVQLMPTRCQAGDTFALTNCAGEGKGPTYFHCQKLADGLGSSVEAFAIWASSPPDNSGLVPLLRALRHR
ncbi:MAG: hypothetical protein IT371_04655 [Deltaproteobacteria bacterium]|nr:hypothetical protein [Deltaproteobacteria bacterium]